MMLLFLSYSIKHGKNIKSSNDKILIIINLLLIVYHFDRTTYSLITNFIKDI